MTAANEAGISAAFRPGGVVNTACGLFGGCQAEEERIEARARNPNMDFPSERQNVFCYSEVSGLAPPRRR